MVIEKRRHLLQALVKISETPEVREYEQSFLKRYARAMNNRQSYFVNRQRATSGGITSMLNLLNRSKN